MTENYRDSSAPVKINRNGFKNHELAEVVGLGSPIPPMRTSREELVAGLERVHENVHLGPGVVEGEGSSASGCDTKMIHQWLRAVMPSPDRDSLSVYHLSLIHISEPTRLGMISYAVFCL